MNSKDKIILFDNVTFSDLMRKIYQNSEDKDAKIAGLIRDLQPLIKTTFDATVVVPLIKEYMEIGVKNDDALVKLAGVVQRFLSALDKKTKETGGVLTEEEKNELLKNAKISMMKIAT